MPEINLRPMERKDWPEVADLIYLSTNYWYETHGMNAIFKGGPDATMLSCEVYESLDPGCCILAVHPQTGRLMGSCFYHPRETHVSLGIMNVHPNYFGKGVAGKLLQFITNFAGKQNKPVRLISSAMNLDSFSLYTRAGFVPRIAFQDMYIKVPESGMEQSVSGYDSVREATLDDVVKMADLEMSISHIRREKDYRYFIENKLGIWHTSVYENNKGEVEGFLVSVTHTGSNMLGPGAMRTQGQAAALILAELNHNKGRTKVLLAPVECEQLVQSIYAWGARNCEMHFCQVWGEFQPVDGVIMPTFMPETG